MRYPPDEKGGYLDEYLRLRGEGYSKNAARRGLGVSPTTGRIPRVPTLDTWAVARASQARDWKSLIRLSVAHRAFLVVALSVFGSTLSIHGWLYPEITRGDLGDVVSELADGLDGLRERDRQYIMKIAEVYFLQESELRELKLTAQQRYVEALSRVAANLDMSQEDLRRAVELFVAVVELDIEAAGPFDRALAAFAKHDFDEAADSAARAVEEARRRRLAAQVLGMAAEREIYMWVKAERNALRLQGQSLSAAKNFECAVDVFQTAIELSPREDEPEFWAEFQSRLAVAAYSCAYAAGNGAANMFLTRAVNAGRAALEVRTQEELPLRWAETQHNLALALSDFSEISKGSDRSLSLDEAVTAFGLVLTVWTIESHPREWATVQNNLGGALIRQAQSFEGIERAKLLDEVISIARKVLVKHAFESLPHEWVVAQNNLGIVFWEQSKSASGLNRARKLGEAATAYRVALKEDYTKKVLPLRWAAMQQNLAIALTDQAESVGGAERARLLSEAVAAYRLALEVRTQKDFPLKWAATQNNLGAALGEQSKSASGPVRDRLLDEAVAAYNAALQERSRDNAPQDWALTKQNLGTALIEQANRAGGVESKRLLGKAMAVFLEALQVLNRENFPLEWGMTKHNLSTVLWEQSRLSPDGAERMLLLEGAEAVCQEAFLVHRRESLPQRWASTQHNLGLVKLSQAQSSAGSGSAHLFYTEAVSAFHAALEVRTLETLPLDWAMTHSSLAVALKDQADSSNEQEKVPLLLAARNSMQNTLRVYTRQSAPASFEARSRWITDVEAELDSLGTR